MIKISVIVPVFNVEKYLQQCIDSLIAQEINACEFIFINDASTDGSLCVLLENQKTYPDRIRIIDLKKNIGLGRVRNLGIESASGEYIGFVDSDDFVAPYMFQELYDTATTTNADATFIQYASIPNGAVYCSDYKWDLLRPLIKWNQRLLDMHGCELRKQNICDLIALQIGGIYCGLYKRKTLLDSGIRFPVYRYEDNYWGSLIKPFFHVVAFIEKIGYAYRENPESITHKRNQSYQLAERISIENMIIRDSKNLGFFNLYHDAYEWCYTFRYAINTFYLYINTFDTPDVKMLVPIEKQLRQKFPRWFKNPYFKTCCGLKEKLKDFIIVYQPGMAYRLLRIKKKINRIISVLFTPEVLSVK